MLIKEGWRCRLDGWRQTEQSQLVAMTMFPPMETERMASLTQIASLERTIYNVQDRRNLFANIWKTFMGSTEDLELKKHNYILLKVLSREFTLEIGVFPLKPLTFSSIYFCFLHCQVWASEQGVILICLIAVGLIHRKIIRWQSLVFKDIPHMLEWWLGSTCHRNGARYCGPSYCLSTASYSDGKG